MKKIFLLLFVIVFCFVNAVLAEEAIIEGYKPGEFAVKSDIFTQLLQKVIRPINQKLIQIKNGQTEITIIGFADKTGVSATNDRLGRDRAEEVKSVLSREFPTARITAITRGDEVDSRMVVIQWKITAQNQPINAKENESSSLKSLLIVSGIALVVACFLIILVLMFRTKKLPEIVSVNAVDNKQQDRKEVLSVVYNGKRYSVQVEVRDGFWYLPFPNKKVSTRSISKPNRDSAKKEITQCMRDSYYQETIKTLIEKGTIRIMT